EVGVADRAAGPHGELDAALDRRKLEILDDRGVLAGPAPGPRGRPSGADQEGEQHGLVNSHRSFSDVERTGRTSRSPVGRPPSSGFSSNTTESRRISTIAASNSASPGRAMKVRFPGAWRITAFMEGSREATTPTRAASPSRTPASPGGRTSGTMGPWGSGGAGGIGLTKGSRRPAGSYR